MLLSQIKQTSCFTWSPLSSHPSHLALGTLHSTLKPAQLQFYQTQNVGSVDKLADVELSEKFVSMDWGEGLQQEHSMGILAGGMDDSSIQLFDVNKILQKEDEPLISKIDKHTKQVNSLCFNPKQPALLAAASSDSNVSFWNLKKPEEPVEVEMQGKNPHQNEEVSSIAWNVQFDSIAASCSKEGLCTIWELKESKSVLKFSNQQRRNYSSIAWNPEVGTQLAVASQLDDAPVIELWDLRKAYTPMKELKAHTGGVLSLSWCPHDANLLLSSGKDGNCFIWNPATGEQLGELPSSENWMYDVKWAQKPSILSTASYDERISIYSLQDSSSETHGMEEAEEGDEQEEEPSADGSFMGAISGGKPQQPSRSKKRVAQTTNKNVFKTAPKWLKRPIGCSFGFGGRIVTFSGKKVKVKSVTFDEFANQQKELEEVIENRKFEDFCNKKVEDEPEDSDDSAVWSLMRILFTQDMKQELLRYLGFSKEDIAKEAEQDLPEGDDTVNVGESKKLDQEKVDSIIENCVITSNWEGAVDVCLKANRLADALVLAASGGKELWNRTREEYFQRQKHSSTITLVGKMLNELDNLVDTVDLSDWKKTLAILCTFGGDHFNELVERLAKRLEDAEDFTPATICYMSCGAFERTINIWLKCYKRDSSNASKQNLIRLMQKIVVFQQAYPNKDAMSNSHLNEKYAEYATLLASQVQLQNALQYLNAVAHSVDRDSSLNQLRYRVFRSMFNPPGDAPLPPSWAQQEEQERQRDLQMKRQAEQRKAHEEQRQAQRKAQHEARLRQQQQQPMGQQNLYNPAQQQFGQMPQQQQQWQQYQQQPQGQQPWNAGQYQQQQYGQMPQQQPFNQQQPQEQQFKQQPGQQQFAPQGQFNAQGQQRMYPKPQDNQSPGGSVPLNPSPCYNNSQESNSSQISASPASYDSAPVGEPEANFGLKPSRPATEEAETGEPVELGENQAHIMSVLESKYSFLAKSPNLQKIQQMKLGMIEKDLGNLRKHMQTGRMDNKVEQELKTFCQNLEQNDFKASKGNTRTLASTYRTESKAWIKGVKFLAQSLPQISS